jgi:hypothetical protein
MRGARIRKRARGTRTSAQRRQEQEGKNHEEEPVGEMRVKVGKKHGAPPVGVPQEHATFPVAMPQENKWVHYISKRPMLR